MLHAHPPVSGLHAFDGWLRKGAANYIAKQTAK